MTVPKVEGARRGNKGQDCKSLNFENFSQPMVRSATLNVVARSKSRSFDDLNLEYGGNESMTRSTSGNCMFKASAPSLIPGVRKPGDSAKIENLNFQVTEERVGLVVSKKGYMHFLEGTRQEWYVCLVPRNLIIGAVLVYLGSGGG